ncbi:hypothetical protein C1N53_09185 [Pontibacter sp. SGAir0037]|nr:hypothetical protein C1N53_09185 [Pontibacter sp. SGAir0037]
MIKPPCLDELLAGRLFAFVHPTKNADTPSRLNQNLLLPFKLKLTDGGTGIFTIPFSSFTT